MKSKSFADRFYALQDAKAEHKASTINLARIYGKWTKMSPKPLFEPFPLVRDPHGRIAQRIVCEACGTEVFNQLNKGRAGPEVLANSFKKKGWHVDFMGRHCLCPACVARKQTVNKKQEKFVMSPKTSDLSPSVASFKELPSEESILAKSLMMERLLSAYDARERNYRPGWSDERIAQECKLSVVVVAKRREEDFGPLPPPKTPLVVDLERHLDTFNSTSRIIAERLTEVATEFELLRKSMENIVVTAIKVSKDNSVNNHKSARPTA